MLSLMPAFAPATLRSLVDRPFVLVQGMLEQRPGPSPAPGRRDGQRRTASLTYHCPGLVPTTLVLLGRQRGGHRMRHRAAVPRHVYLQPDTPDPVLADETVLALARRHAPVAGRVWAVEESGGEARTYLID